MRHPRLVPRNPCIWRRSAAPSGQNADLPYFFMDVSDLRLRLSDRPRLPDFKAFAKNRARADLYDRHFFRRVRHRAFSG